VTRKQKPKKMKTETSQEPGPMIRLFVQAAAPIMRERFTDNRCLNSTRVCLEVMSAFNVRCKPASVQALATNKIWVDKVNQIGRLPTGDEMQAWIAEGAWSLAIDTDEKSSDPENNAWAGHLVAIVQDHLVDCSSLQMNRPHKSIALPEIFVGATTSKFLKGKDSLVFVSGVDGSFLSYRMRTDDDGIWWDLPGFAPSDHNLEVAADIANAMARVLGRKEMFGPRVHPCSPG